MIIDIGTPDELRLALLPLKNVKIEIAADLLATEAGCKCGGCHKPFGTARKWRSVGRVVHIGESGPMMTTWLFCGKCTKEAGGNVPEHLRQEARAAYGAARLMTVEAGGTA
jgi:hypothetical protein